MRQHVGISKDNSYMALGNAFCGMPLDNQSSLSKTRCSCTVGVRTHTGVKFHCTFHCNATADTCY
uniref:Uncharacterized protein n=1 Tax=Anguilla anguilla TaxID=7936 RepID=A0A0E9ULD6_ANGAN